MQFRRFGKLGWQVSAIGFGAWGIGGQWGAVERQVALDTLAAALDAGMNFFDTADAYGEPPGLSEELVGQALQGVRDRVLIATKVGNFARRNGHPLPFTSPLHVINCCHASLHRLRTDRIDVYQCHLGDLRHPDVFLDAFDTLRRDGKVRAFGISTNDLEVLKAFDRNGDCATCQLDYSYLNRAPEADLLPYCQNRGIATIIRGPLAMGLAAGKFAPETHFDDSVRSGWNEGKGRERFLERLKVVEHVRPLSRGGEMAQLALQFVLAHPAVSIAIPGAKSPAQARANAAAAELALSETQLAQIRAVTSA